MSESWILWTLGKGYAGSILKTCEWVRASHEPDETAVISNDFFGINVAASPEPDSADIIVARLRELGLRHVRMDFGYCSFDSYPEDLFVRLTEEGFRVSVRLVPPPEEACRLHSDSQRRKKWGCFVEKAAERLHDRLELLEIGSTPNRSRWSGFGPGNYLEAWSLACVALAGSKIPLGGPGVSDFEPFHNAALLRAMASLGRVPDVHTDQLFVERVTEPEAYDHRIAGSGIGRLLKFNLIKKAHVLSAISRDFGIGRTFCTHVCWSRRRVQRVQEDFESKQADYLVRYYLLAAASGALHRVYWGPLSGQREGLLDDGTTHYPAIPRVAFHEQSFGQPSLWRSRPAFAALAHLVRTFSGARVSGACTGENARLLEVVLRDGGIIHVGWTRDRGALPLAEIYSPAHLQHAVARSHIGAQLPAEHAALTETPVFLHWRGELAPPLPGLTQIDQKKFFISIPEPTVGHWSNESYEGVAAEHLLQILAGSSTTINPEHLERVVPALIYRTRRNRVWKIGPPGHSPALVIKKFPSGRRKKKKPCRNWNNACELMRRGINTPRPVGFLESRTGKDPGYFVSESFEGAASARSCFERLREPEGTPEIPREFLFEEMALFAKKLHDRGVYYRDLSAGNLLVRRSSVGRIKFSLVDPGRARFFRKPLPLRLRLADLMRLVHPLSWKCREELVRCYFADDGRFDRRVYFLAFVYYDCKTAVKRFLKRAGQKRNGYGPLLRRIRR